MTYIYNWANLGISHTERGRMHGHEPDGTWHTNILKPTVCWKKLGLGGRLQSETTKAERNHRDFGCYFGPFPAPSSPSDWHGAKEFWRLDPVTHSPGWTQSPITGRCTCQESLWLQSNGSLKINGLILVWKGWYVQFPRSDSHHTARRFQLFHSQHNRMVHQIHQMPWHVWYQNYHGVPFRSTLCQPVELRKGSPGPSWVTPKRLKKKLRNHR